MSVSVKVDGESFAEVQQHLREMLWSGGSHDSEPTPELFMDLVTAIGEAWASNPNNPSEAGFEAGLQVLRDAGVPLSWDNGGYQSF